MHIFVFKPLNIEVSRSVDTGNWFSKHRGLKYQQWQSFVYVKVKINVGEMKSKVWLHFIRVDHNKAKCNISLRIQKDGNTTDVIWRNS